MEPGVAAADEAPLVIVLDTNTLLDWHVFRDPTMHPIAEGIRSGRLRWLACPAMQREWGLVWPRPGFARWRPDPAVTEVAFACAELVADPARGPMRCTDPDDQVFIDLALACKARWLLSKDRALLKLARRARAHGLHITPPARWTDGAVF